MCVASTEATHNRNVKKREAKMDYIVSFTICALLVALQWLYFKTGDFFKNELQDIEAIAAQKGFRTYIAMALTGSGVLMIVATFFALQNVANYLNYIRLIVLFGIISAAAIIDFKKKIIPNILILIGVGTWVTIVAFELLFYRETAILQLKSNLIGFAIGFGVLLIAALVSKGGLGFGDVKLFGVIGLLSGAICTYYTLLYCLLVSALTSAALLILRKKGRKDSIPLGPCILIGYFIAIILTCY